MITFKRFILTSAVLVAIVGCAPAMNGENNPAMNDENNQHTPKIDAENNGKEVEPTVASPQQSDANELWQLLQEIRTLLGSPTANSTSECQLVPIGAKACGGPERFLLYSTTGVQNEEKLLSLASQHRALSARYNEKYSMISNCAVVTRPALTVRMGMCVPITMEDY